MYGYIYETTNLVNGKKYIGKHKSSKFDENYKGSGILLWKAIDKYGWENFNTKLLIECDSLDELNTCEINEIKSRDAVNSKEYYNLSGGGDGWSSQWENPEFRDMMSKLLSSDNNPAKRPEVREKMKGHRESICGELNPNYNGKSISEYQRIEASESAKKRFSGKGNPMYNKRGKNSPHYGKIHINNGEKFITIPKEELDYYMSLGYVKTKNPSIKGKCYMNNGKNSILVLKSEISLYEKDGWTKGKKGFPITHNVKRSSTIENTTNEKDIR